MKDNVEVRLQNQCTLQATVDCLRAGHVSGSDESVW